MSLNLNGSPPKSIQDEGLAALGSLSARDFIDRGLDKANEQAAAEQLEVELGQLSARAFIGVGLERNAESNAEDLGQLSARKFIGIAIDAASKGDDRATL